MFERWVAAAWVSGSGAVGCKGAVDGGGVELRSAEGGGELVAARPFVIYV